MITSDNVNVSLIRITDEQAYLIQHEHQDPQIITKIIRISSRSLMSNNMYVYIPVDK